MSASNRGGMPARTLAMLPEAARSRDQAVAVGSRAGIIEWADSAWVRVTGYDVGRFVQKPVGALLAQVKLEPYVVEFVGSCLRENKVCEIDVPLTTPAAEDLWVHLRVEPVLDAAGEVSDFVAVACDVTEEKRAAAHAQAAADPLDATVTAVDLSELALALTRTHRDSLHEMTAYDLWLSDDLPLVLADESLLAGLAGRLICRAAGSMRGGWGTLSVSTGLLGDDAVTIYPGNLYRGLPHGQYAYLEVHDTGDAAIGGLHQVVEEPFLTSRYPGEPVRLASARRRLASLGGEIRIASSPWFGTAVVLLLPYSSEPELGVH